ncbi:hypothetical protein R1sor_027054 [Riccia sorocarpa]|uniref:Ubiquitin-like protease family profile domain-containing protein n=1 Tax=Riccia sorocarpa TaxID=122646 RepID=A0ABD3GEM9_9MARC
MTKFPPKFPSEPYGIEQASNICESLKIAAQNYPDPIQYYDHMLGIFDSYVNPDGDPDVHPVVTDLDADNFSVDKLLGPEELEAPPVRRDIDGADFEDDLSKRERIRLQSDMIAMRDVLPPVTRSARTRLDYDAMAGSSSVPPPAAVEEVISIGEDPSAGAPAEKDAIMDLVLHTGDTSIDPPTGCIVPMTADVVNLVEDDGTKSPPPSQMIPVRNTELVDLSEYMDSPEENRRLRKGWPTRLSLTKADIQSGCLPKHYMRGDVINCYINERFLAKPRDQLHNMFYVNTFWFTLASNLVHNYEKSNFSLEKLKPITRLRNSISPELRDVDLLTGSLAWIFIPVHGKQHWSLAIIRLIGNECRLCHLDSHPGIHKKSKIFHVLKTFLAHTMPIDTNQIVEDSFEVDEQKDEYTCGFHVLQMLTGAGTKELALDRCYMVERLGSIATLDQVSSFELVFANTGMQTSSMDPVQSTEPASESQPATVEPKKKKKKAIPDVQAAVAEGVDVPSPDEVSLIPPNGIPGEVCLGIRVNVEEFKNDFTSGHRVWSSGKLNIRDNCTNNFLKRNWEKWRKQAKPPYLPPKAEVRKSFLHYASLELHGVKVDWTTVDLFQAINTVSYERRMAARCELFRMRVRMDGRLVETMDPYEMEKSQKGNRSQKRKRMLASETKDGVPSTDNSPPWRPLTSR